MVLKRDLDSDISPFQLRQYPQIRHMGQSDFMNSSNMPFCFPRKTMWWLPIGFLRKYSESTWKTRARVTPAPIWI